MPVMSLWRCMLCVRASKKASSQNLMLRQICDRQTDRQAKERKSGSGVSYNAAKIRDRML